MNGRTGQRHWSVGFFWAAVDGVWFFLGRLPAIVAGTLAAMALVAGLLEAVK